MIDGGSLVESHCLTDRNAEANQKMMHKRSSGTKNPTIAVDIVRTSLPDLN